MPSSSLKFAIAGCGRIAERHAEQIQRYGSLIAVCDVIPSKADALANLYNCKAYYSLADLLDTEQSIDLLAVCTPNGLHSEQSIMALNKGIHVLCEKPMAITTADCYSMIDAANRNNKKLFIVKQNRFNPPVVAVRELIEKRLTGKIYSVQLNCFWNRNDAYYTGSWKGTKSMDGGTLFTQFSHFIDLLYWMFGDIKNVQAITKNLAHNGTIEFEDTGIVNLEFENGIIGGINYTVNSYTKNMEGSITIFAEYGTIKIGGQYLNELEYQCSDIFEIKDLPVGNRANNYGSYTGSMSNHDKVYQNVCEVLQNGATMYANALDGLKTVEIIERIYLASNQL